MTARRGRTQRSVEGLSILEIMVSIVLLVIILLASTQFIFEGRYGLDEEERKRTAMEFTSNILEDVRSLQWYAARSVDTTKVIDKISFHTVVTIQDNNPVPYLSRAVAKTTWTTHTGDQRTITFATFVPLHP